MIYTPEIIKSVAPSVFATSPSPKMTDKYSFVPTEQVLEFFDREGWQVSSVKQTGRGVHSLHEIKFRNGELPAAFSLSAGLFRLVCSNGLTVPTSVADRFTMRHNHFTFDEVKGLAESFSKKLPMISQSVGRMMSRELSDDEKIRFVQQSAKIRFNAEKTFNDMEVLGLLQPNRVEDEGNSLWQVFNTVQEKFIRGGVSVNNSRGKNTKMRKIDNIIAQNTINTKLWELAETVI